MKLKVYQQGGGLIYTPFIPGAQGTAASSSGKSSGEDDGKLDPLDKELIALMKDQNLLPSDIQAIYNQLIAFQQRTQHITALGGSAGYRSVMPGMLQIMQMVSVAKANKDQWDKSVTEMRKHDAGAEVAMDDYGRMWVRNIDNGELTKVAPSEFDHKKYIPISNSQLLSYRQRSNDMAFSDGIFGETGMDVVGMKDVREELDNMIDKLGSVKNGNLQVQKFSDIAQDIQGMGVYKVSEKYSKGDLNDFSGLLYSRLSNEAKHLVDANAALGGYDKYQYILSIIHSQTDYEKDPQYQASLTKAVGLGGEGGSGTDGEGPMVKKTYVENVITGSNYEWPTTNRFALIGKHSDIWASTQDTGAIQAGMDGGKSIGDTSVFDLKKLELFAQGANQQDVIFGDTKVNESQQAAIMYDGSSLYRVELPATESNGDIVPDWSVIDKIDLLKNKIDPAMGTENINRILKSYDPNLYWDENTKTIRTIKTHVFLTFTGIVGSDFTSGIDFKNSDFFEEITGREADIWHKRYDKVMKDSFAGQGFLGKLTKTHLYRANVFVPVTNALAGSDEFAFKQNRLHNMQTQAAREKDVELEKLKNSGGPRTTFD